MKKGKLLHSALSHEIAKLGHTQTLVLGDAGLPIPPETRRIDLAVTQGVPALLSVLDAVLSELAVQKITLAEEIKTASPGNGPFHSQPLSGHADLLRPSRGVQSPASSGRLRGAHRGDHFLCQRDPGVRRHLLASVLQPSERLAAGDLCRTNSFPPQACRIPGETQAVRAKKTRCPGACNTVS